MIKTNKDNIYTRVPNKNGRITPNPLDNMTDEEIQMRRNAAYQNLCVNNRYSAYHVNRRSDVETVAMPKVMGN